MGKQWLTIFLGYKITADGDCSHEIKRHLLLGWKVMTNLHSIFKSRDITLPTKVHLVKAMVFPVVMYGCESWTVKKAAAAAAKSLQSCPTLCDPTDGLLPGPATPRTAAYQLHHPWDFPGKSTGVGCHCLLQKKKAEHRRIDAFELWCWRRLLRVPSTARRSNQSIWKEISPGISLEGMMLKLKLQYFAHLM